MKNLAIILVFALSVWVPQQSKGQVAPQKYFVEFTDKADSPFSVDRPQEFLSPRSIERRRKQGIAVEQNDLPVNSSYVNRVRPFTNDILTRSKWLNGITIYCLNPSFIDSINRLPFVKRIIKNPKTLNISYCNSDYKFMLEESLLEYNFIPYSSVNKCYKGNTGYDYGPSLRQIQMLNGDSMHKMGYRGQGMVIAILDGGFNGADKLVAFDSLWANNQIIGTKDFVTPGASVYTGNSHGMEVLSCIGGNIPGQLIGTAPKAHFWLLRTEDVNTENLIEEYNWVSGAELADSAGADIINSSLGYTKFDDTTKNHTCADMNGNTTPVTKGANMAFEKGMIVVNSAGNSGGTSWKCVGAPSDGYYVLAVAAVDSNGVRAPFSSVGEATHRIKPNFAAMGSRTVVSSSIGTIMHASGTSFSSPLIAGMAACLWQAAPDWSNYLIGRSIELSCNKILNPDSLLGYGIPDFAKALKILAIEKSQERGECVISPNPFTTDLTLSVFSNKEQQVLFTFYDLKAGSIRLSQTHGVRVGQNEVNLSDLSWLRNGVYLLNITGNSLNIITKVIKIDN
ncbi:MAG: S8 family serine peptidase [Bacteroidota bacterium]